MTKRSRWSPLNLEFLEVRVQPATLSALIPFDGIDGANPYGTPVITSNGTLIGATTSGPSNEGTIYAVAGPGFIATNANLDSARGSLPYGGLVMDSSGNLFGTAVAGGASGDGTVYELAFNGTLSTLASFSDDDGIGPFDNLLLDNNGNLFGTTSGGGAHFDGGVFEIVAGSHAITLLASFDGDDGAQPYGGLVMDSSGNLFGATTVGGASNVGTVYKIVAGSGAITPLASFDTTNGAHPYDTLTIDSSGNLFGNTKSGGAFGDGTVFEVVKGSGVITSLASFNGANGSAPYGGLLMDANGNLFGTTTGGGANGDGTIFEVAFGANTIITLASFNGANGSNVNSGLVMDASGNLFGAATNGGNETDGGTVFELTNVDHSSVPPTLSPTNTAVGANEGSDATNTGMFNYPGGNSNVTLSADIGTVKQDNSAGTWSWSLPTTDGPVGPIDVTITATYGQNFTITTTFTYSVTNVAPSATLQTNSGVTAGNAAVASLVNPIDPGAADTDAGFHYAFSLDTDTTGPVTYAGSEPSNTVNFGAISAGTHTVYARIIDKDDGSTLYSATLAVVEVGGNTFTVTKHV